MIGYNISKIEELMRDIASSYENLGQKMADGWSTLSATMEREWVGPDEVSYETTLANDICNLYISCQQAVTTMVNNIKIVGDNWKNFQKNNLLEGASVDLSGAAFSSEIDVPTIKNYEIASVVKAGNPTFGKDVNLGLTNGAQSGTTIKTQFDSYIDGVYTNVKALYSNYETLTKEAFKGESVSSNLNQYLQTVGEGLAKLTTCHKSIYDKLDELVARYQTHETDEATSVSSTITQEQQSSNFNGQNLK